MRNFCVLIKPASSKCNMKCTYCFYHDIADHRQIKDYGFITIETMKELIEKAYDFIGKGNLTLAFQGGEPTLIGLEFYQKVVRIIKNLNNKNIEVHYALQTNGLLIDENWASFFKQNNFLIGLSLDGIKKNHDFFRLDNSEKGTFDRVMETKKIFDQCGVEYNILTVVTNKLSKLGKKVYQFYKKNDITFMQFIPAIDDVDGENGKNLSSENYEQFLKDVFDLWYQDVKWGKQVSIRFYDNILGMYLGYPPESCDMKGTCSMQHVVEANGSVYPCDFYVLDDYKLGNIKDDSIEDMFMSDRAQNFIKESFNHPNECKLCKWYKLCRNGCKKHRSSDNHINYYCSTYKNFYEYAHSRFMELASIMQK